MKKFFEKFKKIGWIFLIPITILNVFIIVMLSKEIRKQYNELIFNKQVMEADIVLYGDETSKIVRNMTNIGDNINNDNADVSQYSEKTTAVYGVYTEEKAPGIIVLGNSRVSTEKMFLIPISLSDTTKKPEDGDVVLLYGTFKVATNGNKEYLYIDLEKFKTYFNYKD